VKEPQRKRQRLSRKTPSKRVAIGVAVVITLLLSLAGVTCFRQWLGFAPFGGNVAGTVTTKHIVVYQSRYGTGVQHVLSVRTAPTATEEMVVPERVYAKVVPGARIIRHQNMFEIVSPDGRHRETVPGLP
jgi:hypothetical protein